MKDAWAEWVASKIGKQEKQALARKVGCHASYITMMHLHGYVPSRVMTERLGTILGCREEAMVRAGFSTEELMLEGLVEELRDLVEEVSEYDADTQAQCGKFLLDLCRIAGDA